eukprot:scaffold66661_cov79-Attheya_sp.AAC.1
MKRLEALKIKLAMAGHTSPSTASHVSSDSVSPPFSDSSSRTCNPVPHATTANSVPYNRACNPQYVPATAAVDYSSGNTSFIVLYKGW